MFEWTEGIGSIMAALGIVGMIYAKFVRGPRNNDPVGAVTMILSFTMAVAGFSVMVVPVLYLLLH